MLIDAVTNQIMIETERFFLRPPRRSDLGLIGMYAADPRVATMTRALPHPLPPGAAEAFIRKALSPDRVEDIWVIDGSFYYGAEVMGVIGLERMERNQSEIAYWVAPAYWNTGIASEAVRSIIAANPHLARTVFAEVFQDNPGSARVLTNCGFDYLGDAEAHCVARGANVPTWTYSLRTGL